MYFGEYEQYLDTSKEINKYFREVELKLELEAIKNSIIEMM